MPSVTLNVKLLQYTPAPEETIAMAARLCYAKSTISQMEKKVEARSQDDFIARLMDMGHLSAVEHVSFTFGVEGVSRSLLSQLTRHRIASFSVQSQRYVSYAKGFDYIIPPAIAALGDEAIRQYEEQMATMHAWYITWQQKLGNDGESANEDARFVLPSACQTRLMMTMNARELLHFFSLRCCNRAQWEIRAMANAMLLLCKEKAPAIFKNAGPDCLHGPCPEGEKSCGHPPDYTHS